MPEAADRALVSVATAYRYFSSAEDLWWEASNEAFGDQGTLAEAERRVEAAGTDPQARLEALIRSVGFRMLDDQVPYRRIAKTALEQWFRQADAPTASGFRSARGGETNRSERSSTPYRADFPIKTSIESPTSWGSSSAPKP